MEGDKEHWSVTLGAIPSSESPTAYGDRLPDPQQHFAWYCGRARELIAAGHLAHALTLLHRIPVETSRMARTLLERVQAYERTLECIKELLLEADADTGVEGEGLTEALRRFSFVDFEEHGVPGLLRLIDHGPTRNRLTQLLFKSGSYGNSLDAGLALVPGCGKAELASFLAGRLPTPQPRSLQSELAGLRSDPVRLRHRVNQVLALLVRRREMTTVDLASWREISAYQEFAQADYETTIEAFCLAELEALQERI